MSYGQPAGALACSGTETVLPRNVNEPAPSVPDSNRPQDDAPFLIAMVAEANTLPLNTLPPLIVADLPTYHQTFEALATQSEFSSVSTILASMHASAARIALWFRSMTAPKFRRIRKMLVT